MQPASTPSVRALTDGLVVGSERPILTYHVATTGERFDLTAADLGSWTARTATMLQDGYRLGEGDQAAVLLPAHWQTAAVLLGAWSIGMSVAVRPWATAGLPPDPADDGPVQAVFVSLPRLNSWLEDVPEAPYRFVLGLAPQAGLLDDVPDGYLDYLAEVRKHPDTTPDYRSRQHAGPATPDGTSYQEWMDLAQGLAATLNLRAGDRLLVDADRNEQPVKWLLAPLSVGASIVLCSGLDPDGLKEHATAEGATHVM